MSLNVVAIIPARYESTRFPGKPLVRETGKYLIQHVYEQAIASPLIRDVWVATDDARIQQAVQSFGGNVMMTRHDHASGSDRLAEAASSITCDHVVNVQGDEPEIEPFVISQLVELHVSRPDCEMATMGCPFAFVPETRPDDPNAVKVLIREGCAIDFSRLPFQRPMTHEPSEGIETKSIQGYADDPILHLGIYAYRRDFLSKFASLPHSARETQQRLEQLRALDHGHRIAIALTRRAFAGIDTPQDYQAFVARRKRSSDQQTREHT